MCGSGFGGWFAYKVGARSFTRARWFLVLSREKNFPCRGSLSSFFPPLRKVEPNPPEIYIIKKNLKNLKSPPGILVQREIHIQTIYIVTHQNIYYKKQFLSTQESTGPLEDEPIRMQTNQGGDLAPPFQKVD